MYRGGGKGEKTWAARKSSEALFAPSGRVEESSPPGGSGEREVRWTREETVRETSRIVREYEEEEKRVGQDGEKEETKGEGERKREKERRTDTM